MNNRYFCRLVAVLLVIFVLCPCLILPGAAEGAALPDGVEDAIGDAIGDAVNDAIADATGDLQNKVDGVLGGIGEDISGITDSILSGDGVETANRMLDDFSTGMLLVVAVVALLLSLFGYRLLKIAISVLGFTAGWILSMSLYGWVLGIDLIPALASAPVYVPYIVYAACGLLCAFLAHKILRAGIFIAAAAGSFLFFSGISDLINPLVDLIYPDELEAKYLIAHILLALLVGLLSRALVRPVLIATTAAAGGMIAAISFMVCIGQTANPNLGMIVGIVLALVGIAVQSSIENKRKARK